MLEGMITHTVFHRSANTSYSLEIDLGRILKNEIIDQNNVTDNESRLTVLVAWSYLGFLHMWFVWHIRRLSLFTKTVNCSVKVIVILQFRIRRPKIAPLGGRWTVTPHRRSNLSSGLGGIPRSWVRSLLLASSIFSCTKRERVSGQKARELDAELWENLR